MQLETLVGVDNWVSAVYLPGIWDAYCNFGAMGKVFCITRRRIMCNIKNKIVEMLQKDMEEFRQRVMTPDGAMLVFLELLLCSFIGAMIGFAIRG
jgi:hypothetical protein